MAKLLTFPPILANKMGGRLATKDLPPGTEAGWRSYDQPYGRKSLPRALRDYQGTYGGTEDAVTWVFSCVTYIASEVAGYDWHCEDKTGDSIEDEDLPSDLFELLQRPNEETTYFDFTEMAFTDLELCGNSYWYKEDTSKGGQPKALRRLRPEYMRVACDDYGKLIGYAYDIQGITVPYEAEEILRFRYANPLDELYGMGTVEAIQRELQAELAQSEHVIGFFSDGARISGVLTIGEAISDLQFERMKNAFRDEYAGAENAFKILIAEQGTSFTPITAAPSGLGIVELRQMSKDAILSAFGVPEFLLGGSAQGGIYKMEEAQHIVTRRLMPKATRFAERLSMDITATWGEIEFKLDQTTAEPYSTKLEHAAAMVGTGSTLNEIRFTLGQPPIEDEAADEPLLQQGIILWSQVKMGAEPPPELAPPMAALPPALDETSPPPEMDEIEGEAVEVQGELPPASDDLILEAAAGAGGKAADSRRMSPFLDEGEDSDEDFGTRVAAGLRVLAGQRYPYEGGSTSL